MVLLLLLNCVTLGITCVGQGFPLCDIPGETDGSEVLV